MVFAKTVRTIIILVKHMDTIQSEPQRNGSEGMQVAVSVYGSGGGAAMQLPVLLVLWFAVLH